MNNTISADRGAGIYSFRAAPRTAAPARTANGGFLALAAQVREAESRGGRESVCDAETARVAAYQEHLQRKYGQVTIQSVGKDRASLQQAGGRMTGSSVVIAPNILAEMAGDPEKAADYEKKIDDFFNATPRLKAQFAAQGLNYEPCGVVIHEDGSVTYIGGCGDSPERVAEVNRIHAEKAREKAEQRRLYQEQAARSAAQRRALWERAADTTAQERACSTVNDLLKMRMASTPTVTLDVSFPTGASLFFLDLEERSE